MIDFELRKEIRKDVFRLVTSVGQDEKKNFFISLPSSKTYHPSYMDFSSSLSSHLLIECGYII